MGVVLPEFVFDKVSPRSFNSVIVNCCDGTTIIFERDDCSSMWGIRINNEKQGDWFLKTSPLDPDVCELALDRWRKTNNDSGGDIR